MSEHSILVPNPRKPNNGWRLANHGGYLHAVNRKGVLWKIKHVFYGNGSSKPFIRISGIPGCNFYNKELIRLSCKRVHAKGTRTLLISLLKTKPFSNDPPEIVFEFFLEEGEFSDISEGENGYKQDFVKNLTDVYVDKPEDELLVNSQFYQIVTSKLRFDEIKHIPHHALTLFNDGKHLYAISGGEKEFLSFREYKTEKSSDSNRWMHFLGKEVMFKIFGHTLNGDVIVLLREKRNSWVLPFSIKRNQTAMVDQLSTVIGIYFIK